MLQAFLAVYHARLRTLGKGSNGRLPGVRVAEEGADIADRMLDDGDPGPRLHAANRHQLRRLSQRAPHVGPRDPARRQPLQRARASPRGIRELRLRASLERRAQTPVAGSRRRPPSATGSSTGKAMQRDRDEVFRFLWENRTALGLCDDAYTEVGSVLPCLRVDQDGFTLRETVADYVQILTVRAEELEAIKIPGPAQAHPRGPRACRGGAPCVARRRRAHLRRVRPPEIPHPQRRVERRAPDQSSAASLSGGVLR